MKTNILRSFTLALLVAIACTAVAAQAGAPSTAADAGMVKQLGSIREISGSDLLLATDQGTEAAVKIAAGARILRFAADLKSATPIQFADLQVGDRVLVRGKLAADGVSIDASAVSVLKQEDIAKRRQRELLDWQRRGLGGVVKQVDPQSGKITLAVNNKTVTISTTPKTTFKRYAPNSVKWEDATTATLEDIHPGDQLRAKGNKNEDGTQLTAEEIVAGTFRNIAGLVTSINSAAGTLTVRDLATKRPVTVQITADSQMKKLSSRLAQGLATGLKGVTPPADAAPAGAHTDASRPRGADLNQLLARLPPIKLGDLQKGDAVMIVGTEGSAAEPPIAITLLGGVEPILTASPGSTGAQSFLTPWSLASEPGGEQ